MANEGNYIMDTTGSYNVTSFAADLGAEVRRLNAQVDLFWQQELALYTALGLGNGMNVLDCGCGPGALLQKLSHLYPDSRFMGVDVDSELVNIASSGHPAANCTYSCQSVLELDFEEGSFDFVISRLVFEHLPEPERGLKQVLRVLRNGGTAVFIDNDFDFHERTWPDCPALRDYYDAYRRARRNDGGNPCIGRHLPELLRRVGFEGICLNLLAAHSQLVGDEIFSKANGIGIPAQLLKTGYLREHTLQALAEQWAEMLAQPDHSVFRVLFAASGKKVERATANDAIPPDPSDDVKVHSRGEPDFKDLRGGVEQIRNLITQTLEAEMEMPAGSLPPDEPIVALGVDSLAALRLCNRLKSEFRVALSISDVIAGKSINEIAANVLRQVETSASSVTTADDLRPRPRLRV